MKLTLFDIVKWTILFCLVCDTCGAKAKKKKSGNTGTRSNSRDKNKAKFVYLGNFSNPDFTVHHVACTAPRTWEESQANCIENFGEGNGLASIETEKEHREFDTFYKIGFGASYWTGGMYKSKKGHYTWLETGEEVTFDDWDASPWGNGEPTSSPTSQTRITLVAHNKGLVKYHTAKASLKTRSLCEIKDKNPCDAVVKQDIMITGC